jgi:hypothetical protein
MSKSPMHDQIKKNLKVDIMQSLKSMGVDFDNPEKTIGWLNLSFYDQKGDEEPVDFENLKSITDKENNGIAARCLLKTP